MIVHGHNGVFSLIKHQTVQQEHYIIYHLDNKCEGYLSKYSVYAIIFTISLKVLMSCLFLSLSDGCSQIAHHPPLVCAWIIVFDIIELLV